MTKVLISGGTGFVGKRLTEKLFAKGYAPLILTRNPSPAAIYPQYKWNVNKQEIDPEAILQADIIIHLAGAGIADKRWSKTRIDELVNSRVESCNLIFNEVKKQQKSIRSFITASGVGYYGAKTSDVIMTEDHPPAKDVMGMICEKWETAADQFELAGVRTVKLRTGVVVAKKGGPVDKMKIAHKINMGSAMGSGKQYLPWIHLDDLCDMYIKAIEDKEVSGPYNAVAPSFINNKDFNRAVAKSMGKAFWAPKIPGFLLKIALGKMACILLEGSRVAADKISKTGFTYGYETLEKALNS